MLQLEQTASGMGLAALLAGGGEYVGRWGWISILAEPAFLAALVGSATVPWMLSPGWGGLLLSATLVAAILWVDHRIEESVRRLPVRVGAEAMVGQSAEVVEPLDPVGLVRCGGESWRAVERRGQRVAQGQGVRVVAVRGLRLEVELQRVRR